MEPPADGNDISLSFVWHVAHVAEVICRLSYNLFGLCAEGPFVARQSLALIAQEITVDDSAAYHDLGYRGHVSIEQGLKELRGGSWSSMARDAVESGGGGTIGKKDTGSITRTSSSNNNNNKNNEL